MKQLLPIFTLLPLLACGEDATRNPPPIYDGSQPSGFYEDETSTGDFEDVQGSSGDTTSACLEFWQCVSVCNGLNPGPDGYDACTRPCPVTQISGEDRQDWIDSCEGTESMQTQEDEDAGQDTCQDWMRVCLLLEEGL